MTKTVLVVAAHPDDEVLGCGGTIARHSEAGDNVKVLFLSDGVGSRNSDSGFANALVIRRKEAKIAADILGISSLMFLDFPDNQMDQVPLLKVVQAIEELIESYTPTTVYTHHACDLNIDHRVTHRAVMTACRPVPKQCVQEILSFEILSSTGWAGNSVADMFIPQRFISIESQIDKKISAMNAYHEELRDYPHARSLEGIRSVARSRGVSVGVEYAEAFCVERELIHP
jgi:LmbE family N-acetylglucosaminyl deacetylase